MTGSLDSTTTIPTDLTGLTARELLTARGMADSRAERDAISDELDRRTSAALVAHYAAKANGHRAARVEEL